MEALRAGFADMFGALEEHKPEVLDETGGKRIVFLEILIAAGPGVGRIKDLRGDALAFGGMSKPKTGSFL